METTNNTPATITPETTEAWKKIGFSADSKIGAVMNKTDFELQMMAQKSIAKIKIPTKTTEIVEAEKLVVEIRNDYTEIITKRKKLTSKFDGAISRLMEPEKTILPAVKELTDAILALKKQAELDAKKVEWHDTEIKNLREHISTHISNHDANCKKSILELIDKSYSFALGNGDIKVEEIESYLTKVKTRLTLADFGLKKPTVKIQNYTTEAEFNDLWENLAMDVKGPGLYLSDFHTALAEKFEFYGIAVKNKVESLRQAAIDKEVSENEIAKQAAEAATAAKLNTIATTNVTVLAGHKDLKKVNIIEMPKGDWTIVTTIMVAFVNSLEECKKSVRVKDIFNLSIEQMAVALCKLKDKDPTYNFGVLKFKLVDKL